MILRFKKYTQVWIWLSFALLVALLALFVRREYFTAKNQVARDIGFVFLNAVREVEGEAFNKLILQSKSVQDSLVQPPLEWQGNDGPKHRKITIIKKETEVFKSLKPLELEVKKTLSSEFNNDLKGNAGMIISMRVNHDTLSSGMGVMQLIHTKFDSAMQFSEYPLRYQLLPASDSLSQSLTIGSYFDIGSGQTYIAQVEQFQWQVWKKILPQVLSRCLYCF